MVIVASYGGGTNSKAMLVECVRRSVKVDLILFADTGAEKPETYIDIKQFSKWLKENGMPEITTVQRMNIFGTYITLEQYCSEQKQLPSLAYGYKSCSEKHKISPQNKFINNWQPAKDVWKQGEKVTKFVGYDADEHHRIKDYDDGKYNVRYPLVEWGMGRDECIKSIKNAGLPLPGKSACFFCPSSRPHEIRELARKHPKLIERALRIERRAELTEVKGLGRQFSWANLLAQGDMFDDNVCTPDLSCGCYDG